MKDKKTKVRLRQGHPNRVMLARLADDSVISIDESGVDIAPELISKEMTRCGWFETGDGPVEETTENSETGPAAGPVDTDNADGEIGKPLVVGDPEGETAGDSPAPELTSAEKAALERDEKAALKAQEKAKAERESAVTNKKKKAAPVKVTKATAKPKACKKGK